MNREIKRQGCKYMMKPCSLSGLIVEREFSTGMFQSGRS